MTSDITARLAALAEQTDNQTRLDAIVACRRYCGQRASAADAHAFALEQVRQLVSFEDGIFVEIRRSWRWLADELEAIVEREAARATPAVDAAETARRLETDAAAGPEPAPKRRRPTLRRPRLGGPPEAQPEI